MKENWERKLYETWDDAFKGLAPLIRQQSVRVAAYTQVLFTQACVSSFAIDTEKGEDRIKGKYADLAYKCGLYHQLGKALVPPEYQIWQVDFTPEEQAVYRKYTTDGRILVAALQERSEKARNKYQSDSVEFPTNNILWLMVREACEQHMERWDGTGYPYGFKGHEISPIAQIVGLAKELDRLASETKSEQPFEDAYQVLQAEAGKGFSEELIEILKACRGKCRNIYKKYIHYTMTLPTTISLVEKRKDRPMGLVYRPMIRDTKGVVYAYEAIPWFGGILDRPGETEGLADVEALLYRTDLIEDISMYLMYEAADAVLRIQNCKLPLEGVVLPMMEKFYTGVDRMNRIKQLYEDQPIDKRMLILTVPQSAIINGDEQTMKFISELLDEGIPLLLDGYHPGILPIDRVKKSGISMLRLAPELYMSQETANTMTVLRNQGFILLGGDANDHDIVAWLHASGVGIMSGTIAGTAVTEDELIRDILLREQ